MTSTSRRSSLRFTLSSAALACALVAGTASAGDLFSHAATSPLDHPPTLYTFKLDDPTLSLLRTHFEAEVERPGPYGRYVGGSYGKWSKQPWITLSWGDPDERSGSPEDETPDPVTTTVSADHDAAQSLSRDVLQSFPRVRLTAFADRDAPSFSFGFEPPSEHEHLRDVRQAQSRFVFESDETTTHLFANDDQPPFWSTGPSLASNGFDALWAQPAKPVVDWRCRRRPVVFVRFGGQSDRFSLVRCNGAVEPGAVDRLSIVARPPEVPDPGELPDEPDPEAWQKGEWLPRVKLVNPRLLWLVQKIADAFPHRAIYIYSGYRPHRERTPSLGQGHHSLHGDGRAMDIQVHGIPNETLFAYCRKLDDVGCGYYPNSKFVHVDVRRPATGHAFWIDSSGPGEPSRYVDSWPGVIEHGALAWVAAPPKNSPSPQGPRPRTPDERGSADVIGK